MFYKRLLLVFLLTLACTKTFSAVFVVTSNADSGPGTLRDALTLAAANGGATQDIIQFNIADQSIAGRTITLLTELPDLSSNLVIDGTTQTGTKFGVSDAKVKIVLNYTPPTVPYYIAIFTGNTIGNLSIKGLWAYAHSSLGEDFTNIKIDNSGTINIDHCFFAGGKIDISDCKSFIFKSNVIGYLLDGITAFPSTITVNNTLKTTIGGNISKGNLMSGAIILTSFTSNQDWTYQISNNKLGTDYTGTSSSQALFSTYGRIIINNLSTVKSHGTITNNEIENFANVGITVSGPGDVSIKGNLIGTDKTGKINFLDFEPDYAKYSQTYSPGAIELDSGISAVIGGDNPGDLNTIAYLNIAILEQNANTVVITHNSIFCISSHDFNIHDFVTQAYIKPLPQVQINSITSNIVSGTATPGARVELFSNNEGECPTCDPRDFFTYVTSDTQGNWSYTGVIPSNIVASAIYNNQTSHFTKAEINIDNLKVVQPQCGDGSGSISGVKFYNASQVEWFDQDNKPFSNSLDIKNLPPGKYRLQIGSDICGAKSDWIEIIDNSIKINTTKMLVKSSSCNVGGSISGIIVSTYKDEPINAMWVDENMKPVGNTLDVSDLYLGKYTLTTTGTITGCAKTYGPVNILNTSGPTIDQSNSKIQLTNCGQSTGAITGIAVTGTGTLKYSWKNEQQQEVGTTKDLAGQPGGKYTLQVTDDTQCGPVSSTELLIPEVNGIVLDESKVQTTIASCSIDNGTITGMIITGNAQYKWVDANNKLAGTTPDLKDAAPGDYTFTAYNNSGCSVTSKNYHVGSQLPTVFPDYTATIVPACFGGSDGSISIAIDGLVKSARWVNVTAQSFGPDAALKDISTGAYKLYLTDQNGCETFYKSYTVPQLPLFTVVNKGEVINDNCGLKTGSISGVTVSGGLPPYIYSWTNSSGEPAGSSNGISNQASGSYNLHIDDSRCGNADISYNIYDLPENISPPSAANIQLCSPGDALLKVNEPSAAIIYRLYDNAGSAQPLQQQAGGTFKIMVPASRSYYISQLSGTCESNRTEVRVLVGLSAINIANTFTPNGDGINDYWNISGIANYSNALVQVFSRYGQKVFESKGYAKPFDGTLKGQTLPVGVYYYIINLSTNCSMLSGSVTIIR